MDIGDLVYVLIGVVWLIYSFLKRGNKKTTSDLPSLSGDVMTEQPVEEYLPSEAEEQVEDPYETVRKEILALSKQVVSGPVVSRAEPNERRERERAEEKLEEALSSTSPSPVLNTLEGLPQKPPKPTRTKKPTLTHSLQKKKKVLPFGEEPGEKVPDFDLRSAVVFHEILKRPEY